MLSRLGCSAAGNENGSSLPCKACWATGDGIPRGASAGLAIPGDIVPGSRPEADRDSGRRSPGPALLHPSNGGLSVGWSAHGCCMKRFPGRRKPPGNVVYEFMRKGGSPASLSAVLTNRADSLWMYPGSSLYLCPATASCVLCNEAMTASRLKEAAFWRGGYFT